MKNRTFLLAAGLLAGAALFLSGCSSLTPTRDDQLEQSQAQFDSRTPPNVTGDAEYNNYIRAQEDVYDNPATIIWCTAAFPTDAAPIFTVPIAGKLTSSSVSYYPGSSPGYYGDSNYGLLENQSVDGMYHGSPPPYRYGFTPGGQYVDFTGLAVFCTTQLTEFQRQTLKVATVDSGDSVTASAEALLEEAKTARAAGDEATAAAKEAEAQAILDGLSSE